MVFWFRDCSSAENIKIKQRFVFEELSGEPAPEISEYSMLRGHLLKESIKFSRITRKGQIGDAAQEWGTEEVTFALCVEGRRAVC